MNKQDQYQLLHLIEKNSKLETRDLAKLLNKSEEDIQTEIDLLTKQGIISGYHTIINWDKTDDEQVSAMIELRVTPQRGNGYEKIAQEIYNYPLCDSLYLMSGSFDFMVMTRKATMKEIASFVNQLAVIEEVITTSSYIVLECYKNHGVILNKQSKKDERIMIS